MKLNETTEARITIDDKEYLNKLCTLYPDAYPSESLAIRAGIQLLRRFNAEKERHV